MPFTRCEPIARLNCELFLMFMIFSDFVFKQLMKIHIRSVGHCPMDSRNLLIKSHPLPLLMSVGLKLLATLSHQHVDQQNFFLLSLPHPAVLTKCKIRMISKFLNCFDSQFYFPEP